MQFAKSYEQTIFLNLKPVNVIFDFKMDETENVCKNWQIGATDRSEEKNVHSCEWS